MSTGLLQYVNPLQGTDSHHGFSKGNTLPLIAMPFGMNHWSVQTDEGSGWFFSPRHRKIQGIRCTHQPSPWMGDYGAFVLMPQVGEQYLSAGRRATSYRPDKTTFKPDYLQTEFLASGIELSMTPTERGAIFTIDLPATPAARLIVDTISGEGHFELAQDGETILGYTRGNNGGAFDGFAHYFAIRVSMPVRELQYFQRNDRTEAATGDKLGVSIEFGTLTRSEELVVRVATSFISTDQAVQNLDREIGTADFDELSSRAEETWESVLGRIQVEDESHDRLTTFYSCLYRTQLFPRIWHEVDAEGNTVHRSPYDGKIYPGVLYTDNGFWDTYRTEYPLLVLLFPERTAEILQGWVNAYREGGWFPQWATPGYRACMVGTHIDAVMADCISRGVTNFDMEGALEGMLKHAYHVGAEDGSFGRIGIEDYIRLGYVSTDHHESVARSLDYAYDDYCIATVAEKLGHTEEAEKLRARTRNYANSFDPMVDFMRGRDADGNWEEPWREFKWGSPYVEGGPWQTVFAVPHDVEGLAQLLGGRDAMIAKLDRMLRLPPKFENGVYGFEIHEMTEMACADFGQYAHSNQPVHHVLYLYTALGKPEKTHAAVHRVLNELYTPADLAGDEDNGEMCAWYVLSSLGIFPACPGDGTWTVTAPLFKRASIHLSNGQTVKVRSTGKGIDNATWNGAEVSNWRISHAELTAGGTLEGK